MVDRGKAVLPWEQMYGILRAKIDSGQYAPGVRIPSVRVLAREYGIATATVRKALDRLRDEGAVFSIPGYANFVSEEPPGNG